ncbi:MAG: hypothetical protein IJI47_03785, partial [Eubacterium sp.]|nr:hypothetical protein [Eubacterium sp.]
NVSLNATNTAKADFAEKPAAGTDAAIPPSYVGTDKPIVITANDSSFTLEGTDAAQYSVKWVNNPALKGEVTKLPLHIESWPVLTAGRNITATEPATISYGGNVLIGDDAESKAVLDAASKAKITTTELQADIDKFRATFSADYTATQLKTATTDSYNLTFTAGTPVITATGSDADLFEKNYELTYADPKGIVVPSAIQITNVSTPQASTHGDDNVNLEGMKFTVHYTADDAGNSAVYTFKNTGDQWYVVAGNNADDSDVVKEANKISKTQLLNNYGVQLRWNTKNSTGLEPDKGLGKANHEDDQKQIVIMVPLKDLTGTDEFAMAKTGNVTINKRPIYAYVKKSPVQIDKPYDGNDYADPSGVTFDFYVPDNPANATDPTLFSKYAKWFAGEDVKINTPAKGERSTGEQLKAVYLGGTAANHDGSYKFNGTSWVECDIAGKDVRRGSDGAVVNKNIQLSNLHLTGAGSDNYTLVNADTWTLSAVDTGFVQYEPTTTPEEGSQKLSNRLPGKITPIDATVTVTTVPPISKNTAITDLKRPVTNGTSGAYIVNGLVSGDTLSNISVFATYPNNDPVQQNVEVTVEGDKSDYAELNYNITPDPQYVMGSIMTIGITNIEILEQPKLEYNHGDQLNLKDPENTDGMKIKVTYSDGTQKVWTYGGTGTSETYPWLVENYASGATPGTSPVDSSDTVADLQDITLVWNDTNNAVTPNETMSCSDTNKGYTDSSNKKVTKIQVKPLLTTAPEATTYADSKYTDNITVSKRQLAYEITGSVTKVYDSDNVVKDATGLTVTLKDSEGNPVTDVTFDLNAAVAANAVTFVSTDTKPDSYAGDKTIAIANFNTYLDGTNIEDAYNMPTNANKTNTATGTITQRPITVTVTTVPTLDTNTATPDEAGGTKYTLPLVKSTNFSVTGPENGTGIFQYNNGILTADEADVSWNVIFNLDGVNTNIATTAPVTFSTGTLVGSTTSSEQPSTVAANYNPTFVANQTTGPITSLVQANHIAVTTSPTKTTYDHGDKLELDGTQVTVYKRWDTVNDQFVDGTTEATVYTYDKTLNSNAGGWKIGETPVAPADVPFNFYWAGESATGTEYTPANMVDLAANSNNNVLSLTTPKNGFTDGTGAITAALTNDPTINDDVTINVNKLQLYMHLSGSAEKVYDKDAKLSKDGTNHYDLTVEFKANDDPTENLIAVGTLAANKIDEWVTGGVITYKDNRTGTPDSYVGTSAEETTAGTPDKTLNVAVGNLGTDYLTLTVDEAKVYKLPTEAGHIIVHDVTATITARPITIVADTYEAQTYETLQTNNEVALSASDVKVYDGTYTAVDDETPKWTLDSGAVIDWKLTYDVSSIDLNTKPLTADVNWGEANDDENAAPHQITGA